MNSCVSVEETRPQQNASQKLCLLIIDKDDTADFQGKRCIILRKKINCKCKVSGLCFISHVSINVRCINDLNGNITLLETKTPGEFLYTITEKKM